MTIEGNDNQQNKGFLERAEEFVDSIFIKLGFVDSVMKVTGGDPAKLAKLKENLQKLMDYEAEHPSTFDPEEDEPDEIDPDILAQYPDGEVPELGAEVYVGVVEPEYGFLFFRQK